ncbi:MAG TPA: (2Fe-2S)-binding protein [Bryobacteraceae bacterium]|nr:(2Fe-2S)-binding protein [Bryobacteraceae bacterium]
MSESLELNVNGVRQYISIEPERTLLEVLREDLDLTGTKYGCGEGQCGACTVLVEGRPARSCQTQIKAVVGKRVTTIEGLAREAKFDPLREALLKHDAMQCGYCTSGMVMSAAALLSKNPGPERRDVIHFMDGNICRCGAYPRIVEAILEAAGRMQGGRA